MLRQRCAARAAFSVAGPQPRSIQRRGEFRVGLTVAEEGVAVAPVHPGLDDVEGRHTRPPGVPVLLDQPVVGLPDRFLALVERGRGPDAGSASTA